MERRRLKGQGFHTEPSLEITQTWGGKAERGGGAEAFHQWVEMIEVVVRMAKKYGNSNLTPQIMNI